MEFKYLKVILSLILVLVFSVSCSMLDSDDFYGGEELNPEKLSEMRSSVFASEKIESQSVENTYSQKEDSATESQEISEQQQSLNITESAATEITTEINIEISTEETIEETSEKIKEDMTAPHLEEQTVYWVEKGKVWHLSSDCSYIKKSKSLISGTVGDAISAGKEKVCSRCGK